MSRTLTVADLRFINRVAARRFAGGDPEDADDGALTAALAGAADGGPLQRTTSLVAALLRERPFATAPLQTALLVLHCALAFDGLSLLAPQGVLAGMTRELAAGADPAGFQRWLEDHAVPAASGD